MAGILKQLWSISPALKVFHQFRNNVLFGRSPLGDERYFILSHAWEQTLTKYESKEPKIYQTIKNDKYSMHICKVLAMLKDSSKSIEHTANVLASFIYPAYAQVPESRSSWLILINTLQAIGQTPEDYSDLFLISNPNSYSYLIKINEMPFDKVYSLMLQT